MTKQQTTTINFDDAVTEGKKIVAATTRRERESALRLGQLADSIEPKYRDQTLAKFAKAIGIASCTLARHRSVYRAWKDIEAPGPVSYAVMRELQDQKNLATFVKKNPEIVSMSKTQVRELVGKAKPPPKASADFERHTERWFAGVYKLANDVLREIANMDTVTPEVIAEAIAPEFLPTIRQAGEALLGLVARLEPKSADVRVFQTMPISCTEIRQMAAE